jgi:hypothetical protein
MKKGHFVKRQWEGILSVYLLCWYGRSQKRKKLDPPTNAELSILSSGLWRHVLLCVITYFPPKHGTHLQDHTTSYPRRPQSTLHRHENLKPQYQEVVCIGGNNPASLQVGIVCLLPGFEPDTGTDTWPIASQSWCSCANLLISCWETCQSWSDFNHLASMNKKMRLDSKPSIIFLNDCTLWIKSRSVLCLEPCPLIPLQIG